MKPAVPDETRPRIQLLTTRAEHERILPLLGELYGSISPETLRERLHLVREDGWRCAALIVGDDLLAVAGYWVTARFCYGKYLYVDHFIVADGQRRAGLGQVLLAYLHDMARAEGCERLVLDTYVANDSAQRFWFKNGFKIVGFHFGKDLRGT